MVVGGYSAERPIRDSSWNCIKKKNNSRECRTRKGRVNDVELLSLSKKENKCSRFVNPLFGQTRQYEVKAKEEPIWENEAEIYGLTGVFSKDAAIVCGGKNRGTKNESSDLNICWEWDTEINE